MQLPPIAETRMKEREIERALSEEVMRIRKSYANLLIFLLFCSFQAGLYVVFLLVLSYGLIYGSTQENPMQYRDTANVVRLICEILSIIFLIFYLVTDIDQAIRYIISVSLV